MINHTGHLAPAPFLRLPYRPCARLLTVPLTHSSYPASTRARLTSPWRSTHSWRPPLSRSLSRSAASTRKVKYDDNSRFSLRTQRFNAYFFVSFPFYLLLSSHGQVSRGAKFAPYGARNEHRRTAPTNTDIFSRNSRRTTRRSLANRVFPSCHTLTPPLLPLPPPSPPLVHDLRSFSFSLSRSSSRSDRLGSYGPPRTRYCSVAAAPRVRC